MALDGDVLGAAVAASVNALTQAQKEDLEAVWKAACGQFVAHIVANAVVLPTGSIPPPLTAPSGGGPVTGTGKIL